MIAFYYPIQNACRATGAHAKHYCLDYFLGSLQTCYYFFHFLLYIVLHFGKPIRETIPSYPCPCFAVCVDVVKIGADACLCVPMRVDAVDAVISHTQESILHPNNLTRTTFDAHRLAAGSTNPFCNSSST